MGEFIDVSEVLGALLSDPSIIDRELARRGLADFMRYVVGVEPAAHHLYMIDKLESVLAGKIRKLMIFAPPGSAKSSYTTLGFAGWYRGRFPDRNIITATHTSTFSTRWGRKVRGLLGLGEWPFEVALAGDSRAADEWETEEGGEYFAVGVGGAVTGRRADLGLIDDPIKGREDANSEVMREKLWEWYTSDFVTRLKPGAPQIIILTRWHHDDLAGRILPEDWAGESGDIKCRDGSVWHVVCLPAQAETDDPLGRRPGEWLWPKYYTPEHMEGLRSLLSPTDWASLYQQKPSPEEGALFQREWLKYYDELPPLAQLKFYGASDYAVTTGGGDYTVHIVVAVDDKWNIYLVDLYRDQVAADKGAQEQVDRISHYNTLLWFEEKANIERTIGPFITKMMRDQGVYGARVQLSATGSKEAKAQSFVALMASGQVLLPRRAPWLPAFERELLQFPFGKHDDQVDPCSLIGRAIARMIRGEPPATDKEKPIRGVEDLTLNRLFASQKGRHSRRI